MAATVTEHVLRPLKVIGISGIFGVSGDYTFPEDDAIVETGESNGVVVKRFLSLT